MAVALILSDHNRCVKSLTTYLESVGWCLSSTNTSSPAHGDTISGSCLIIIVIHSLCASMVEPLHLKSLPPSAHTLLAYQFRSHLIDQNILCCWQRVMMTSCTKMSNLQQHYPSHRLSFLPVYWWKAFSTAETLKNLYRLAQRGCRQMAFAHLSLCTRKKLSLVWDRIPLWKSFSHPRHLTIQICPLLWIQRRPDLLAFSTSKYVLLGCCCLEWLLEHVHPISHIFEILTVRYSLQINFQPQLNYSSICQWIGARLPSHNCQVEAYAANPKCCAIRDLILNPSKIYRETIKNVHYSYQQPLSQSLIIIKDEMLIFIKPIRGSTSNLQTT